jgi:DNA repair exonuclease SbcCD ATPase subunit
MTKWNLPKGRKPLTDADIAALTRRLAGTAVDYKELYEAAKRDAEEAEAYAAELEAKLKLADEISNLQADRIEELENARKKTFQALLRTTKIHDEVEAQLAKALDALELADAALSGANMNMRAVEKKVKATIAELKEDRGASG